MLLDFHWLLLLREVFDGARSQLDELRVAIVVFVRRVKDAHGVHVQHVVVTRVQGRSGVTVICGRLQGHNLKVNRKKYLFAY